MFRLFFCQETSERYDIDIYLLLLNSTGAIHGYGFGVGGLGLVEYIKIDLYICLQFLARERGSRKLGCVVGLQETKTEQNVFLGFGVVDAVDAVVVVDAL